MEGIERRSVIAEAGVMFQHGDQWAAGAAHFGPAAEALKTRYNLKNEGQGLVGDIPVWIFQHGRAPIGQRGVDIEQVQGGTRLLSVLVHGSTQDALDVLDDVWELLRGQWSAAGPKVDLEAPPSSVYDLGVQYVSTVAIVKLPVTHQDLLGPLAAAKDAVSERLLEKERTKTDFPAFRLEFDARTPVASRQLLRKFSIESRVDTLPAERIYFTKSPLSTDDHFALLQRLCDAVRRPIVAGAAG